jgi:hypothetical protein
MVTLKILKTMLYLFLIAIIGLAVNCSNDKIGNDDELSIQRTPYTGNQLRINGYYYQKYGDPEKLTVYFLYENGILLYAGSGYEMSKMNEFENKFASNQFIEKRKDVKFCWGLFNIDSTNIMFERWYPSERPYKAYIRAGEILNDTTFVITQSYRMKSGKKTEIRDRSETYQFKQFDPKPDSTNKFIK